jgi:hypothetical protein
MRIIAIVMVFPLAACGIGAQMDARTDYLKATEDYKQCMTRPGAPQSCEQLRLAMEEKGHRYHEVAPFLLDKITGTIKPGTPPPEYAAGAR